MQVELRLLISIMSHLILWIQLRVMIYSIPLKKLSLVKMLIILILAVLLLLIATIYLMQLSLVLMLTWGQIMIRYIMIIGLAVVGQTGE